MSKLILQVFVMALIVAWLFAAAPVTTLLAEDADKETEKTPPTKGVKEKEKKPKTVIEWEEITTRKGALEKRNSKNKEMYKVEFTSEANVSARVKWTTKGTESERGGSLAMTLYKLKEGKTSSDKGAYQRMDRIGNARGKSEGVKAVSLPKGEYYIELDGDYIEYEITIEAAMKKEAP